MPTTTATDPAALLATLRAEWKRDLVLIVSTGGGYRPNQRITDALINRGLVSQERPWSGRLCAPKATALGREVARLAEVA